MTSAWDKPKDMMVGIENVGAGWHPLIKELEQELNELSPQFELHQVKEKFGGLRYYADPQDGCTQGAINSFRTAVRVAEDGSFHICEICGRPGQTKNVGHWIKTLCEEHRAQRIAERAQNFNN